MANVVVAGGSGFLGSFLCKRLVSEGHRVFALDNLLTGKKSNVTALLENPQFSLLEHDVTKSLSDIADRLRDINFVFHLASPASPNKYSEYSYINYPVETLLVNSIGTFNLINLAKEQNAKFLYASSSEIYGNATVSPQPETYFGNVNPNGIRSVYDEGKRFGEAMTWGFRRKYNVDSRIVRIFNTYGPFMQKDDGRAVSNFINQALEGVPLTIFGNGSQTRSFCYVDDMIDGLMKAMFAENTNGEVINLGNPDERKISEIAKMIKDMVGGKPQIVFDKLPSDDPLQRKPDITKAMSLLGWQPQVSLTDGLKKTIKYFRSA